MRLDYVPNPPQLSNPEDQKVVESIQARRKADGLPLIPLDYTLLHAPAVAAGWNAYMGAIRTKTSLTDEIRELCILRPAIINGAWFEWNHHLPLYQNTPNFDAKKLDVVSSPNPKGQGALPDAEWAVLKYADAMTRDVTVPQAIFDELRTKGGFTPQQIVEITATVASYNMVSRFLVALDVGELNGKIPTLIKDE